jgi:YD repeat-containing protein
LINHYEFLMNKSNPLSLKYRFEKVPIIKRPLSNAIERFGGLATGVIQSAPSLIPYLTFGRAEHVAGGILDPGLLAPQPKFNQQSEQIRIRSIEHNSEPLVEFHYDKEGRISEVILLGSIHEKYTWSDKGELLSVSVGSSLLTQFKYRNDGLLLSINYPNGSIFKYGYDERNRLAAITYPDGITVKYSRNKEGLVTCAACRDGTFEYVWDENLVLQEVQYHNSLKTWSFKTHGSKKKLNLPFQQSSSSSFQSLTSALGFWRYIDYSLIEMFVPSGQRNVKRNIIDDNTVASWRLSGQTTYVPDKSGVLMKIHNTDGSIKVFKRLPSNMSTILVSANGVGVLNYDEKGRLKAERDCDGQGTFYSCTANGLLASIKLKGYKVDLKWNKEYKLYVVSLAKQFQSKLAFANKLPEQLVIQSEGLNYFSGVEGFISFLWYWQENNFSRRLIDKTVIKQ